MKNFVKPGKCITLVNPSGAALVSGQMVVCGSRVFVATGAAAIAGTVEVLTEGVVRYSKTTGQAYVVGTTLYYDPATDKVTSTAGSLKAVGYAAEIAASADTSAEVSLCALNV